MNLACRCEDLYLVRIFIGRFRQEITRISIVKSQKEGTVNYRLKRHAKASVEENSSRGHKFNRQGEIRSFDNMEINNKIRME